MKTTTAPKRKTKGERRTIEMPKRTNLFPIAVQIQLVAMSKRHDKSRNRAKQKRSWQE